MTFCKKLYTVSRDVKDKDAECAEWMANASNQEEHLAISESGNWSTAVDVGGLNISGESACILCVVGKFEGKNSVSQGFLTRGGGGGGGGGTDKKNFGLLANLVQPQSMVDNPLCLLERPL